jgi:ATP-dependent RNA helicase HrpA
MAADPLADVLRRDQHRLRRERDRLRDQKLRGNDVAAAEATLAGKIAASAAARAARAASVPAIRYPDDLPIAQHREEIRRAIEQNPVVIVCGETGSGKTTQLPKICLEAGRGVAGVIGHTHGGNRAAGAAAAAETCQGRALTGIS